LPQWRFAYKASPPDQGDGTEENRFAGRSIRPNDFMERARGKGIEPVGWFIQDQKSGVVQHGADQG
jgi:hypothetical protein